MQVQIENELLKVRVDTHGAELVSILKDGKEFIWQADPDIWGRHAPILFPIVGKLKDNEYKAEGNTYSLSQHGFARDSEFELAQNSEDRLVFKLVSSEVTLKKYPYKFELNVEYRLQNNKLSIKYIVKNTDSKTIYFTIGAHPGFACPDGYDKYHLEFEEKEKAERHFMEDGLYSGKRELVLDNENVLELTKDTFKDDVLNFRGLKSRKVTFKNRSGNRQIEVEFSGFPYLGIWAKHGAPFVCIEPWFGLADSKDSDLEFSNKEGIRRLEVGEEFECEYSVRV